MRTVAVDLGTRRIGLAIGAEGKVLTSRTIEVKTHAQAVDEVISVIKSAEAEKLVFGLPLRLNGTENKEARRVREFALEMSKVAGLPAVFVDERLTTLEAKHLLGEQGLKEKEMRRHLDALAARLLLEQYYRDQWFV